MTKMSILTKLAFFGSRLPQVPKKHGLAFIPSRFCSCLPTSTRDKLMIGIAGQGQSNIDKVTVVGAGDVGMACVFSILSQGVSSNVVMVDMNQDEMQGELLDLQHGGVFLDAQVTAAKLGDYASTADSKICLITAGVRRKKGESRLDLVQRNTDVLKAIIPNLVKFSPETIMIVITNPCDILTWVCWKLSGFPKNRVIGAGTNLDSARFRFYIAKKLNVSPDSVHAWIVGEHGDSSVALWSGVSVAGVRLVDLHPETGSPNDPENWKILHKTIIMSAYEVIKLKGCTNWAIGLSATSICKAILKNSNKILPVSTDINGMCGVDREVFLSLPCVIGRTGVDTIIDPHPAEDERCYLGLSAEKMIEVASGVKF